MKLFLLVDVISTLVALRNLSFPQLDISYLQLAVHLSALKKKIIRMVGKFKNNKKYLLGIPKSVTITKALLH